MRLRYIIPAAVAILTLSFYQENESYGHDRASRTGHSSSHPTLAAKRAALTAKIAAQNPFLNAQQVALLVNEFGNSATATRQLTRLMPSTTALAAQIAAQNPQFTTQQALQQAGQLSAQQAALIANYYGSATTATRLMASNTATAELAAQIARQNPQLTTQQATLLANRQISAITTQQAELIAAQNPQLTPQQVSLLASLLKARRPSPRDS